MDGLKSIPSPGETALLNDPGNAGLMITDKNVILGSPGAALTLGERASLVGSTVRIGGTEEIRLVGRVVIDGELVTEGEKPATSSSLRSDLAKKLRATMGDPPMDEHDTTKGLLAAEKAHTLQGTTTNAS